MTWSSRTAYCSREKPSFFHGNMSLSLSSLLSFFFFFSTVQFHFEKHWRLNVLFRLSGYVRELRSRYRCIDNIISSLWVMMQKLDLFLIIGSQMSVSVSACKTISSPQMIDTTFSIQSTFLLRRGNLIYSMCLCFIYPLIQCTAWSDSPTCYFPKYLAANKILLDRMTIADVPGRQMIPRRLWCSDIYEKCN